MPLFEVEHRHTDGKWDAIVQLVIFGFLAFLLLCLWIGSLFDDGPTCIQTAQYGRVCEVSK